MEGRPSIPGVRIQQEIYFNTNTGSRRRKVRPLMDPPGLAETTLGVGRRETGSKSSMSKWFINMDAQDKQDYLAGGLTVLSSTIAYVPTQISPNPLPGSWIISNTRPIIERVLFLWRGVSSC